MAEPAPEDDEHMSWTAILTIVAMAAMMVFFAATELHRTAEERDEPSAAKSAE
jgi:hypothetical protein